MVRRPLLGCELHHQRYKRQLRSTEDPNGPTSVVSIGETVRMRTAADVVREFHERMQARDWDGAGELLDPSIDIRYTATGERFVGAAFLAMNRAYPDGWTIHVHEVMTIGGRVAAQVRVDQGPDIHWCAGFYTVRDGRIVDGVEHWVTERSEPAPAWRQAYTTDL